MTLRLLKGAAMAVGGVLLLVMVLCVLTFAAFPWLATKGGAWVQQHYGLEHVALDVERPRPGTWTVNRIEVRTSSFALKGESIQLSFDFVGLLHAKINAIEIARLELALPPARVNEGDSSMPFDASVLAGLPMESLTVDELQFSAPAIPLRMHGTLEIGDKQLRFRLEATESPLSAPVRLTARLSADGNFLARFHTSENKAEHALEAHGRMQGDTLAIAGSYELGDYELALISGLAGEPLPVGDAKGDFAIRLDESFNPQAFDMRTSFSIQSGELSGASHVALDGTVEWMKDPAAQGWRLAMSLDAVPTAQDGSRLRLEAAQQDSEFEADGTFVLTSAALRSLMTVLGYSGIEGQGEGSFKASGGPGLELSALQLQADAEVALVYDTTTSITAKRLSIAHTPAETALWQISGTQLEIRNSEEGTTLVWKSPEFASTVTAGESLAFSFASKGDLDWQDDQTHVVLKSLEASGRGQQGEGSFKESGGPGLDFSTLQLQADAEVSLVHDTTSITAKRLSIVHAPAEGALWRFSGTQLEIRNSEEGSTLVWKSPEFASTVTTGESFAFSFASKGDLDWQDDQTHVVLTSLEASGKGQVKKSGYLADVNLSLREQSIPLKLSADENLEHWRFSAPLKWVIREPLLVKTLGMTSTYDVIGGSFSGNFKGELRGDVLGATITGTFNEGVLAYDDLLFKGLSTPVVAELLEDSTWAAELPDLRIASFDPGVPLTEVHTGVTLRGDLVSLATTSGKLLGGSFSAPSFTYDIASGKAEFGIDLANIDLGAVLALEGKDLYGEGRLDGHVPISLVDDAITVTNGTLRNTGKGVIRLAASLVQSVNQPGLDFALRALGDFQYETLEADIDYDVSGNLLAAIRLRGRNPAIEKGRAIHYNLNISENVPTLLASLRLQDEVNKSVERRVRQGATR